MGPELEGSWEKYFRPIPVSQTKGTRLQSHPCHGEACPWPQREPQERLARAARALPCGFSGAKD